MNVTQLIKRLRENGIDLSLSGNDLDIRYDNEEALGLFLDEIKNNKAEIVSFFKKISPRQNISKAFPRANYPLSSSQRRLWILNQFENTNLAYNLGGVDVFEGRLDVTALENCLKLLIERHETLRTIFKEDEQGEVRQFVISANDVGFTLDFYDLRNDAEQKIVIRNLVQELILHPFDLATGPLLRAGLYQVEDNKWVFTHAIHHIISDAWTMNVLLKELLLLYDAQVKGEAYPLQPLPIQYKDYAVWQQEQLQGAFFQTHKDWWLKQFEGELPVLQMPGDKMRPAVKSYNGGVTGKRMNRQLIEDLKSLANKQGGTLFMGLLATLNTLLYRYTSQEDIIIGSPIAAREHIDLEDQLGFYVNTLALRTRFSGGDSFIDLLEKVKGITLGAYEHQMYPFDELVSELKLHRDMSRNALFDVMIVLHPYNIKMDVQQMGEVKVTAYEEAVDVTSKFDLLFRFTEWGEEVQLNIEYNNDIYDKITAEQLIDHFERLLNSAIAQPEVPVQQLDLLSTAEKDQLLLHFNNTTADYPRDKTIVSLFEEQAAKTPDSIALVFKEKQFTYGMLNDLSNQLGNYLRTHYRVQPDDLIGIKLVRNEWMIMSILGVLKSGGAYVPIDPEYPQERIDYIIADSRCKVVIDEPEFLKFQNEANKYDGGNLVHINNATDLTYVMYTSGSTGKPKGVMIEHRNVVSLLQNFNAHLFQDNTLIIGAAASYTFDMSVLELIGPLAKGVKLFLIASADPLQILKHISDGDINALQITPSRLTQLIESGSRNVKALGKLKVLLVGGEALGQSNYERLKELTGTKVKNMYGPTETTVWSSCLDVQTSALLSIGKPLLNETIYITDQLLNICPRGVVGEICIGGEGVGRGYWGLPELTAEKFVDNPFKPGERLYKTGDMGRWLIDGNIEFIGRKDDQVKIRGYRVELGEIESALLNHPAVTAAVVIAKHMKDTSRELVAYIVSGEKLPIAELRTYLSRSLPVYMLPAHFVQLYQLPLTSRGKVDKRRLPDPNGMDIATGTAYVSPRNAIEEKLALIWQEVLGLDRIGVKDNFFNLGGHSLKATRLASRIHKAFEVKIAFIDLFKYVLFEDQAMLIEQAQKTSFVTIPAIALQNSYPLSSSQRRLWILSQFEEANIAYNIPGVYVLEGALNTTALSGSFDRLIMRHEILRTVFKEDEQGNTRQFVISAEDIGFKIEHHDLRKEAELEEKAKRIVQNEFIQPFDLATGPLLRASLLHIDENKWVFTCTMHHIISDGWSKDVLIKELLQFYNAHVKGETNPLVPLRIHYKDYAVWQQEQLSSEALKSHKNYWVQQFTGELPVLELPEDKVRPLVKTYNGGVVKRRLSPSVNKGLNNLVREQECTLFMGLLAAVNTLLFKYTNQEDIIIGTPIAGRMHSDLEDQIGFYVNTLAIRTRFTGTDDYRGVLKSIRQLTLNAYEHQVYPFDELVTELGLQRDMSRSALFDVMVTLQNAQINHQREQPILDDIRISAYELAENTVSRFDLEFGFVEVGEELLISLVYNSDIYNKSTAGQFINHLNQLIEVIIACPGKPINELEFLSEEEKYRQLIEFNNTDGPV